MPNPATVPDQPGAYWCTYDNWQAIVFLAGQAPLLQISGLQVMTEDVTTTNRYVRNVDLKRLMFGQRIIAPDVPPRSAQSIPV